MREPAAPPSPMLVFEAITAYQRTAAIRAAIQLDVFTAVGEGPATPLAIAERCGAAERGIRILCDRLVVDGFLTKTDGSYGLSPTAAAFLDTRSPACLAPMVEFLTGEMVTTAYDRLTDAVRRGGTALDGAGSLDPEHPTWVQFARAMAPSAGFTASLLPALLGPIEGTILDVAAGHGLYGITLARENAKARVVAQDWRSVLAVAEENARQAGVADRFTTLPGSAFDVDFGTGHAVVLLTNFLHHFAPETNAALLRKVLAALAPGGRAVAVEFVPDADRVTPPEAGAFALTMLATTPTGDAWTHAEYDAMFRAAGFAQGATLHELAPTPQRCLVAVR
ncbi:MAG: class I SAM-dependent methyltransferase [bacterium]|nr:class I SAM-dependent methyltransferase [bacterium]